MVDPFSRFQEELVFARRGLEVCEGPLAAGATEVIDDFMLENPHQPRSLGRLARKIMAGFERSQKSFLHDFFGQLAIAQPQQRKTV